MQRPGISLRRPSISSILPSPVRLKIGIFMPSKAKAKSMKRPAAWVKKASGKSSSGARTSGNNYNRNKARLEAKAKQLGYRLRRIDNVELHEPKQVSFLRARAMAAGFLLVKDSDSDSEDGGKSKKPAARFHTILRNGQAAAAGKSKGRMDDTILTDKDKNTASEDSE